jgi:hypothetical protein
MNTTNNTPTLTGRYLADDYKFTSIEIGNFKVIVKLTSEDKFVSVTEVGEKRSFMSSDQKTSIQGYHEIDKEFYPDLT